MKVRIATNNAVYKDGVLVGGFHEKHEINHLSSANHLIDTINAIIQINQVHTSPESVLEALDIECDDQKIVQDIEAYKTWFFRYPNIKIYLRVLEGDKCEQA